MGERELNTGPITPPTSVEQMIVLDAESFAEAVREALKSLRAQSQIYGLSRIEAIGAIRVA